MVVFKQYYASKLSQVVSDKVCVYTERSVTMEQSLRWKRYIDIVDI